METRLDRYEGAREKKLEQLKQLIKESNYIVFLGGAGVSTESGIPDFRSGEGIFNQESGLSYRPVDIISHSFFEAHPEEFFDFYRRKLCYPKARPNKAHRRSRSLPELQPCRRRCMAHLRAYHCSLPR